MCINGGHPVAMSAFARPLSIPHRLDATRVASPDQLRHQSRYGSHTIMCAGKDGETAHEAIPAKGTGRRAALSALMAGALVSLVGSGSAVHAEDAKVRVWGAAELDFRMYVCGATGKFCPAMTKVTVAPARQIDEALAQDISEIPGRVLESAFSKRGNLLPAKLRDTAEALSDSMLSEFQVEMCLTVYMRVRVCMCVCMCVRV